MTARSNKKKNKKKKNFFFLYSACSVLTHSIINTLLKAEKIWVYLGRLGWRLLLFIIIDILLL